MAEKEQKNKHETDINSNSTKTPKIRKAIWKNKRYKKGPKRKRNSV